MPYNLIDEAWIPVRCRSGERRWITPWQMADRKDPPVRIDSGRPDFDGALMQFLIGLMQTTAAPADNRAWRKLLEAPPEPEYFQDRFGTVRHAFNLDGDGPRFMQDLKLEEKERHPIRGLLIDAPGEFDHFVKRDMVEHLSFAATAAALFTMQVNAPAGGRGYRTGLRGGGPLTTLVSGDDLFEFVVRNVLTATNFRQVPGIHEEGTSIFPWLQETRTSERDRAVDPLSVSALIHFWAMPRRIRVEFRAANGVCHLYPESPAVATEFVARPYGAMYQGAFLHPLTPYSRQKDGSYLARKGRVSAFRYRDWANLTVGTEAVRPSLVVMQHMDAHEEGLRATLNLFGYDMDNAKALAFRWTTTFLPDLSDRAQREQIAREAELRVEAATTVLSKLLAQLRRAWEGERPNGSGDMGRFEAEFWARTEAEFFASISSAMIAGANGTDLLEIRERWLSTIHGAVLEIFDEHAGGRGASSDLTLRRIALARRDLVRFTHPNGRSLRKTVDLAPVETATKKKRASK